VGIPSKLYGVVYWPKLTTCVLPKEKKKSNKNMAIFFRRNEKSGDDV
jgi:hypothetical protein